MSGGYVIAGPAWPDHLPRTWPDNRQVIDVEPFDPSGRPRPSPPVWRCGWGDGCDQIVGPRRGLCPEHSERIRSLGKLKRPTGSRSIHRSRTPEQYAEERRQQAAARTEAKRAEVVAFVLAAGRVVPKRDLADALGGGEVLNRAIAAAVERGEIISRLGGPPSERGYHVP